MPLHARQGELRQTRATAAVALASKPADGLSRACALGLLAMAAACQGPGLSAGFGAPDQGADLHAAGTAARGAAGGDTAPARAGASRLVDMLDSDDPAERVAAIHALEPLSGDSFAYDHSLPAWQRQAAIRRWRQWLAAQPAAQKPHADVRPGK